MGRNQDLPSRLAAVDPGRSVPVVAQVAVAAVVMLLVATIDLRGMIGFSSFGVLLYYAIANASAWTQEDRARRWPRALQAAGLAGCLTLVATLPLVSVVVGVAVLAVGCLGRALTRG